MSAPGSSKRTRSPLSRELVTNELLDKATKLFAEKGYEQTTLQDIAVAVGISRSALYHYINSKDDMLVMLVEKVSQELALVLETLSARDDLTPLGKLRAVVGLLVQQRAEHPDQFRILDRSEVELPEVARADHAEAKRKILRELVSMIEAGQQSGEFRELDSRVTAFAILGMCNWVAWWFRPGSDVRPVVATVTSLAEAMLTASPAGADYVDQAGLIAEIRERIDRLAISVA